MTPCTNHWYNWGMPALERLYRRHSPTARSTSKISARSKRACHGLRLPDLDVWAHRETAIVPRQSTGLTDLQAAEAIRAALIATAKSETAHGPTISECIEKYLASRQHELGEKTYGQTNYSSADSRITANAEGVYFIRELNVDLLETFKVDGLPDLADTSKSTVVAKLRCFLRDAFRRGWISESLVDRVTAHRAVYDQKEPYSDEEVEKILNEALKLNGGTHGYAKHPKTFRLLLELMLETGMRVGDAIRFDPALVTKGEHLWIYTYLPQKQKRTEKPKSIEAYLTDRLKRGY